MPNPTLNNYIDGEFVPAHGTGTLDVVDPRTERVVAVSPVSDATDVDAAMAAAERAFPAWKRATPDGRQQNRRTEIVLTRVSETP